MRRDSEFFEGREPVLLYIAKRLKDALKLESLLTESKFDYAVETDNYVGGIIFRSERVGAFFYVLPEKADAARELLRANGYKVMRGDQ
jgi:hypothetical protein